MERKGQFDGDKQFKVGCTVNLIDDELVLTSKELHKALKQARHRGAKECVLSFRPAQPEEPRRPLILQSLRALEAPPLVAGPSAKPHAGLVYEEGMGLFREVLRHVERGDYTWRTLPPGALRDLGKSRGLIESAGRKVLASRASRASRKGSLSR